MIKNYYFTDAIEIDNLELLKDLKLRIPVNFEHESDKIKKSIMNSLIKIYIIKNDKELKIYENYIQYELVMSILNGVDYKDKNNCITIDLKINEYLKKIKKLKNIDILEKIKIKISGIKDKRELQMQVITK